MPSGAFSVMSGDKRWSTMLGSPWPAQSTTRVAIILTCTLPKWGQEGGYMSYSTRVGLVACNAVILHAYAQGESEHEAHVHGVVC